MGHLLNPRQTGLLARLLLCPRLVQNDHPFFLLEVSLPRQQLPFFLRTKFGKLVVKRLANDFVLPLGIYLRCFRRARSPNYLPVLRSLNVTIPRSKKN